jgi:4'-phosphopantetheinyl transferase
VPTTPSNWLRPPRPLLPLAPGQIHVWRLAHNPQCLPPIAWESALSPDEHSRANRFAFHRDRNAYITTRAVLRELLGQYLAMPPDKIQFHYAERGKPAISPTAGDPPVHFNVSHTRSLALLAFSSDRRLGIDVEFIRIKARGDGLHLPLDSFDVTLTPGAPERLAAEDASNWTLVSLYPKQGYAAALTAEGQNINLQLWDYDYSPAETPATTPPTA